MIAVGQRERATQNRVIRLFESLGYAYLGNWQDRAEKTRALKQGMMQELLTGRIRLVG